MSDTMPHSLEAEVSLLGAMMLSRTALDAASAVESEDFYRTAHRHVFDAILTVAKTKQRVDVVDVLEQLASSGKLNEVGGATAVHAMTAAVPTAANGLHYAKIVAKHSRRRRIISASLAAAKAAADLTSDIDETVKDVTARMLESRDVGTGIVTVDDMWDDISVWLADGNDLPAGVNTGWSSLDRLYRVVPGCVTVVTGAPGAGKSQLVDCLALNLAHRHGWKIGLFSPEQGPPSDHVRRLAWTRLGCDPRTVSKAGRADQVTETFEWLNRHVSWIDDMESSSVPSILARAQTIRSTTGLDLLVIDPWNKLRFDRPAGIRDDLIIRDVLADIVRWARRTLVHVIVVAHPKQLDRETPNSTRVRVPGVYDISGGAEFNNQADVVISVWRDVAGEEDPPEKVQVRTGKVRKQGPSGWGEVGSTDLWFDQTSLRYSMSQHQAEQRRAV